MRKKLSPLATTEYVQVLMFIGIRHFRKTCSRKYIHNEQITGTYSHGISSQYGRGHEPVHERLWEGMNSVKLVRGLAQGGKSPTPRLLVLWSIFSFAI